MLLVLIIAFMARTYIDKNKDPKNFNIEYAQQTDLQQQTDKYNPAKIKQFLKKDNYLDIAKSYYVKELLSHKNINSGFSHEIVNDSIGRAKMEIKSFYDSDYRLVFMLFQEENRFMSVTVEPDTKELEVSFKIIEEEYSERVIMLDSNDEHIKEVIIIK